MQRTQGTLTLEEFFQRPDTDEKPDKEFLDGRVEVKRPPQPEHGKFQGPMMARLDEHAGPRTLPAGGALTGEPVLPDFRLPAAEAFGWPVRVRPQPAPEGA